MYKVDIPIKFRGSIEIPASDDVRLTSIEFKRTLVVGTEEHKVLFSYRNGDESRIFICESPPYQNQPVECEYCQFPELHGVKAAINGVHPVSAGARRDRVTSIACRLCGVIKSTPVNSVFHERYAATQVAECYANTESAE